MQDFWQKCIEIELTVAEIYRQFIRSVPCDEELREIWRRMAEEEEDHARHLRFAGRLPVQNGVAPVKVAQLLTRAKTILEGARKSSMSAADALRVSMKLEGDFQSVHVETAAAFADPDLRRMFGKLARCDQGHQEGLETYYRRYFGQAAAR